jgi:undecaprenyl-diphosphatase
MLMDEILQAIILGIIQGITEWLPVSSSGHLAFAQQLLGVQNPLGYSLLLHVASLAAVIIFLRQDIKELVRGAYKAVIERRMNSHAWLALYLSVATVPAAVFGLLFSDMIEGAFSSPRFLGFSFLATAGLLFSTRFFKPKKKPVGLLDSVIIGLFQALALFPGISRSGASITGGMLRGISPSEAARFSFLLFIPAASGALLLEHQQLFHLQPIPSIVGFSVTFILSLVSLSWLLSIVRKGKLYWFSIYCLVLGLLLLL